MKSFRVYLKEMMANAVGTVMPDTKHTNKKKKPLVEKDKKMSKSLFFQTKTGEVELQQSRKLDNKVIFNGKYVGDWTENKSTKGFYFYPTEERKASGDKTTGWDSRRELINHIATLK